MIKMLIRSLPEVKKIMTLGGSIGTIFQINAHLFDVATHEWETSPIKLQDRSSLFKTSCFSMTILNDKSVLICNMDFRHQNPVACIFNPYKSGADQFENVDPEGTEKWGCMSGQSLVTLKDGNVLRLGGWTSRTGIRPNTSNLALFNMRTKKWSDIPHPRRFFDGTYCVVMEDGNVLITGGSFRGMDEHVSTCIIFNPRTHVESRAAPMTIGRKYHAGCLLEDGRVFVHGGVTITEGEEWVTGSFEIYDPQTNRWEDFTETHMGRYAHSCILLSDGKIFISGGDQVHTCDIYDPIEHTLTVHPALSFEYTRYASIPIYQ
jgi:hypothetical protein